MIIETFSINYVGEMISINDMSTLQKLYIELSKSSTKNSYCIVLLIKSCRIGQTNLYWEKKSKCNLPLEKQNGSCWKEV